MKNLGLLCAVIAAVLAFISCEKENIGVFGSGVMTSFGKWNIIGKTVQWTTPAAINMKMAFCIAL